MLTDRRRTFLVWGLVALGTLILFVGSLTVWVKRQALDTEAWVGASSQILANEDVREALAVYLVDELYTNVDVSGRLEQRLPENLEGLAAPLAGALRRPAEEGVVRILERPRVVVLWEQVNRAAHEALLRVLENETRAGVSTEGGTVVLDLRTFVVSVGEELGFGEQLEQRLPAEAGQVTILESDQLAAAQDALRVLKTLSWLVIFGALAAFGGALWLARDRRITLRTTAVAVLLVGIVLLVIRRAVGSYLIDALAEGELAREATGSAWLIGTSIMAQMAWALVAAGLVMLVGAFLAGPTTVAHDVRSSSAPFLRDHAGAAWSALAGVYLLLVLWGPIPALRNVLGVLLLGALVALGFEALRRQAVREAGAPAPPEAPPAIAP